MPVRVFAVDGQTYDDLITARMLRSAVTDGVVAGLANELQVQAQSPETDDVQVATGRCWARGGWLQVYDAPEVMNLAAASADDRWDRIVARRDASVDPVTIGLAVLQGTPAAAPTKPALTQTAGGTWEVLLADVFVPAGSTQIYANQASAPAGEGYIVDARTWSHQPIEVYRGWDLALLTNHDISAANWNPWGTELVTFAKPSSPVKIYGQVVGSARRSTDVHLRVEHRVEISTDGGTSWTNGKVTQTDILANTAHDTTSVGAQHAVGPVVPSGEVRVRAMDHLAVGASADAESYAGSLYARIDPA